MKAETTSREVQSRKPEAKVGIRKYLPWAQIMRYQADS